MIRLGPKWIIASYIPCCLVKTEWSLRYESPIGIASEMLSTSAAVFASSLLPGGAGPRATLRPPALPPTHQTQCRTHQTKKRSTTTTCPPSAGAPVALPGLPPPPPPPPPLPQHRHQHLHLYHPDEPQRRRSLALAPSCSPKMRPGRFPRVCPSRALCGLRSEPPDSVDW